MSSKNLVSSKNLARLQQARQDEDPDQRRGAGALQVSKHATFTNAANANICDSATVKGGAMGGVAGLAAGALGVYAASARYPAFRSLTLPFRAFLIASFRLKYC